MSKLLLSIILLIATIFSTSGCVNSSESTQIESPDTSVVVDRPFNYDDYSNVLKTYVNESGLVNYQQLQANRQSLDQFVAAIAAVPPATYQSWDENTKLAFLINAYNALTLQSIIDRDPLPDSIKDIPGVWSRREFNVAGEAKTLNNIEHDTIRKDFNEPRIHVALVCAAMSCPPLLNKPYLPEKLNEQLNDRVKKFISSPHGFKLDRTQNRVELSSIYKWYGEDWIASYGIDDRFTGRDKERAVLNFISQYLSPEDRKYLEAGNHKIDYLDYDWSLNRQ
jgi:hypothetical protein